ncbi:MAG: energy transducer TonB [Steroidobacteraceae bacterium]|jgi:protein TonB
MNAYYPQQESSLLTKRGIIFLAIIVIHVLVIYAFASGLAKSGKRYLQTILQTNIINQEKVKELPPPPPPVDLKERPPIQVVAPEVSITIPVETAPITVVKPPPPPAPVVVRPPPPGTPVQVTFRPDISNYYPEAARREGQEGRAIIKICVNQQGKIDSADVATSSGFPELDEAAIKVAKAYRFKPATSEGKPVSSCPTLPVKFELHMTG